MTPLTLKSLQRDIRTLIAHHELDIAQYPCDYVQGNLDALTYVSEQLTKYMHYANDHVNKSTNQA